MFFLLHSFSSITFLYVPSFFFLWRRGKVQWNINKPCSVFDVLWIFLLLLMLPHEFCTRSYIKTGADHQEQLWPGRESKTQRSIPGAMALSSSSLPWPRTLPCTSLSSSKKVPQMLWDLQGRVRWPDDLHPVSSTSWAYRAHSAPISHLLLVSAKFVIREEASKLISFLQVPLKMGDQEDGHWDSCVFVSSFWSHLQLDAASHRSQPKYLWKDDCEVK